MAEIETDADTGNEILYFIRGGRPYLYLRDAKTKLFIKRLRYVEKRVFMVVDYSKEEAKKGNPLYVDAGIFTQINAEEFLQRDKIDSKLDYALTQQIKEMFGEAVVEKLLELAGEEYGSKPEYTTKHEEAKSTYLVVWKHKPEQSPQMQQGELKL
jgi:dihydroneopterin aldolase